MSEKSEDTAAILAELASQGFEIVKDESGLDLVKLLFMDENDEASGFALVSAEDAKKILSGEATLQNVVDDDGKQVLTIASVPSSDQVILADSSEITQSDDMSGTVPESSIATAASSSGVSDGKSPQQGISQSTERTQKGATAVSGEDSHSENQDVELTHNLTGDTEQYTLTEHSTVVNNKNVQVVTLLDAQGQMLDQKQGEVGEQVTLEMHGQLFAYELQGPATSGEPLTSTLLLSTNESEQHDETASTFIPSDQPGARNSPPPNASSDDTKGAVFKSSTSETSVPSTGTTTTSSSHPAVVCSEGQQFTLTEATALTSSGQTVQAVILADEHGNILDQKEGQTGEHVIIEMSGNSLEYVFLGPTETGEAVTTTLVITTEAETAATGGTSTGHFPPATEAVVEDTEAGVTAATWCPSGLPQEFYTILRRQAEAVVATHVPTNPDGSPFYRPEQYHRKLGSYATYMEMVEIVKKYRVSSAQGETLINYELLRNYAKIYRPSGPQSRALNQYELALNEAAAQICRYQPGLLFHKRQLFHLAKETVDRAQNLANSERRQHHQTPNTQRQPAGSKPHHPYHQQHQQQQHHPVASPVPLAIVPQTAAVGGRVASSQLAMLESRGLTGMQQQAGQGQQQLTSTAAPISSAAVTTAAIAAPTSVQAASPSLTPVQLQQPQTQSLANGNAAACVPSKSSLPYFAGLPKRDPVSKLTSNQEQLLRAAALEILLDLPRLDIKPKCECTSSELTCWEQAKRLTLTTPDQPMVAEAMQQLLEDAERLSAVRDAAAVYGRPQTPGLMPGEVACNEAACLLAAGLPSLLTHRRELADLAKKVVRNSNCWFPRTGSSADELAAMATAPTGTASSYHSRFYCPDQMPELDLSAADQLLTDPMDRSDSPDSGYCMSPVLRVQSQAAASDADHDQEGRTCSAYNMKALALSCEECNNVIDDVTIFTATGTDTLKRVRILNLSDCGFTGMVPIHMNQCYNLVELNLSNNALCALPRCLHLPKLKRLNIRGNPHLLHSTRLDGGQVEPPLVEQFPRLATLELDPELVPLLSPQALSYLCPYLKSINGVEFVEETSDATIKAALQAKNNLSSLIYSKWEDDIATFYKKGIPKRDTFRIIETLVLHAVKLTSNITEPFKHCTSILARRVAEDFLVPKVIDDEDEEGDEEPGGAKSQQQHQLASDDEEDDDDEDDEDEDDVEEGDADEDPDDQLSKRKGKRAATGGGLASSSLTVEEREAEAAAANLTLLPEDPPDRLINVVGQALRHGKTVVYAVIRTAARQPNGELIPVGGGQGITSSVSTSMAVTAPKQVVSTDIDPGYEDEMDCTEMLNTTASRGKGATGPSCSPAQRRLPFTHSQNVQRDNAKAGSAVPSHSVILGSRRPGLLYRPVLVQHTSPGRRAPSKATSLSSSMVSARESSVTAGGKTTLSPAPKPATTVTTDSIPTPAPTAKHASASQYVVRPSQISTEPAYVILAKAQMATPTIQTPPVSSTVETSVTVTASTSPLVSEAPRTPKSTAKPTIITQSPRTPSGRKPRSKRPVEVDISEDFLRKVVVPSPHAPPPATMRMSTRDTNRLKRFSVYGVIDTAAALAGDEDALMIAAMAEESERETETARRILENAKADSAEKTSATADSAEKANGRPSVVMLSEEDAAWAEAAAATPVVLLETNQVPESTRLDATAESPRPAKGGGGSIGGENVAASAKKEQSAPQRRRRSPIAATPVSAANDVSPASAPATRKRASTAATPGTVSPKPVEPKRKSTGASAAVVEPVSVTKAVSRSLSQLGKVVDYDPVHFIRCHARDNDPLDCDTKVWRCAFEPSVNDPHNETSTVVATCGGECVCLIDCRSGRVMKRFKHFGEEFYTLAWTTVEMAAGHKTNLLAAAGKLREIRLLHPEQLVCYAEMRGHKDDIACMIFHPSKPTILFSGDAKANILVWDIGIPSAPEYRTRHQQLMRLACPRANLNPILNMVFLSKFDALLAGCEDGVFSWTLPDLRKEKLTDEKLADMELKIPTRREPCFDGLAQLSDSLVVVKCVEEGEIYVFDYLQVLQRPRRSQTSNKHPVPVELRGQLRWQTTDEIYINVTSRPGLGAVICGDNEGTIWLYDLSKQIEDDRKFKAKPVKILEWPECSIGGTKEEEEAEDSRVKESITSGFKNPVVNTTDVSHDGEYLVAVTDNNLVCIWKYSG